MDKNYVDAVTIVSFSMLGSYLGIYIGNKVCNYLGPIIKQAAHNAVFEDVTRINKNSKLEKKVN